MHADGFLLRTVVGKQQFHSLEEIFVYCKSHFNLKSKSETVVFN